MTAVRELPKGLGCIDGELREAPCIRVGVPCDERYGCFEIVDRGIGPDYWPSHLERRFFTCSWLVRLGHPEVHGSVKFQLKLRSGSSE